jgi:hypothetical protein
VRLEVECIDRRYLSVYDPPVELWSRGVVGYVHSQFGLPVASTAPLGTIRDRFVRAVRIFATDRRVPIVDFVKGQRKDDVMHLAGFTADEGVLLIGRA